MSYFTDGVFEEVNQNCGIELFTRSLDATRGSPNKLLGILSTYVGGYSGWLVEGTMLLSARLSACSSFRVKGSGV